jgi:hypothetical protein
MSPKQTITTGNRFPYDETDAWWEHANVDHDTSPPKDWAHSAARGVVEDLRARQGIKHAFENVGEATRKELVSTLTDIIRYAHQSKV